jgi:hypothetical protein
VWVEPPGGPEVGVSKASTRSRAAARIAALAARHGLRRGKGFREAMARARDGIDLARLEAMLTAGQIAAAEEFITRAVARLAPPPVNAALRDATVAGGALAAREASNFLPGRLDVSFDVSNPRTAQFMQRYQLRTIREMTRETRAVVRQVMVRGLRAGQNPLDTAREVRASIGLTRRQEAAVANYRRMLEEGDREALARALRDKRYDSAVVRAAEEGTSLSSGKVEQMVGRYRQRYEKYRSEVIARTEGMRAVQSGQQELWRQTVEDGTFEEGQIRRIWVFTADSKVRDWHASIPDRNPDGVGLEEPFDTELGPLMYPGDPDAPGANTINCRCTVVVRYEPSLVE